MVGSRWSRFAVLTLLLSGLLLAPAAFAAEEPETNGFETFTLKASNGYTMFVLARWEPGYGDETGEVIVVLGRGSAGVAYIAPAKVTYSEIRADLGGLGRIDLEVNRAKAKVKTTPSCQPKAKIPYFKDTYVGEIEFHGEEGYTDVSAKRARSSFDLFIDSFYCGLHVEEEVGGGLPGAQLRAFRRLGKGARVALQANQNRPEARVKLQADLVERRGRIQIIRAVEQTLPGSVFTFDPKLRSASLRPPPPFSGAATFRRYAKPRNRWTGNLAVDFPGRSNVALAGARFRAALAPARWTEEPPEFR